MQHRTHIENEPDETPGPSDHAKSQQVYQTRGRNEGLPHVVWAPVLCGEPSYVAAGNSALHVAGAEPLETRWGLTKAGKPRKRLPQACLSVVFTLDD